MRQHLALGAVMLGLAACGQPATSSAPSDASAPPAEAPSPAVTFPTGVSVTSPAAGATTASPLTVTGVAPNDWYFEAVFDAVLLDAQGNLLTQAPAQAQTDWTQPGPVPFKAVLSYAVDATQTGTVVLTEDQTAKGEDGDDAPVREVRIPVVLRAH
ncbi:Gmad2 immunoglobulin-like domain-containing protein [Brevundimonas goettingensis]|uniref:Bacterial spore germination immunoglobulin-like domain-containing protein n=1 Tax=Brevundimonas goettingensis TaxID=2774190 RepID=A0A975C4V7_9CAUL|nr:Gmad2 immunoglobulin-like domain-containing protein [Brevundimonas goettingensis]QTC93119.1 hypothetical protein IFJ75_09910 [Brevundimonas goettingensis]